MTASRSLLCRVLVSVLVCVVGWTTAAAAGPEVDLHDLRFYVHVDLVDPGAGRNLAFWQDVIDDAVARGSQLLVGVNGPADTACCTQMARTTAVTTFGSPGDGLDVVDSLSDQQTIGSLGGSGSRVFLVDTIDYCAGPGSASGCAALGACGNPNDDPDLWLYLEVWGFVAGEISDTLPSVLAHERGHNSCLQHVATNDCQLMQGTIVTPGLAGCLFVSECSAYREGRTRTSSGAECACHDLAGGPLPDGTICSAADGLCSGGRCGAYTGDAGVALIAAAEPGEAGLRGPEDALRLSGLTGDWTNLGQIDSAAAEVRGLAWAEDGQTLWGVIPTSGNDLIVRIDPTTGQVLSPVAGSISNGADEIISMAYDPGPTPAPEDDRLLVLEINAQSSFFVGEIRSLSPMDPSSTTLLGSLSGGASGSADQLTGLAYDSQQGLLFLSSPFGPHGLWRIDLNVGCPPGPCLATQFSGDEILFRRDSSLAYSARTGMLYLVGSSTNSEPFTRTFFDVIDPSTGQTLQTLSLDRFTPGALAALPEPGWWSAMALGTFSLVLLARNRSGGPPRRA
jgi:hypothetical protein